ncbi:SurA N-terminal domain-containing protein [uncultured Desulfosarcina sp.]|uniref:peptidylprolyl isomerase n=1 Tax=uncultured Desulfosarcina sp. TaxID=218289 RepID=UPI0029C716F5|nr:SurA N-terminal domain-containing protein [uncultured Desulfosarcina sp.]
MGIRYRLVLAGIVATLMLVFAATATASAAAEVIDRIVAVVNEDIILLSELKERMAPFVQRIRSQGYDLEKERTMIFKVREEILNRLVDEKLTDQEIKRNDLQVDDTQIDNTIETIKKANSFTDEDLRRFLEQENMTMDQYRDKIREQVLRSRLVNYEVKSKIVITDEEIQSYYDSHPEIYGGKTRYHLRNILMMVPENPTDEEKETVKARMQILRTRIQQGESFAELAKAFSQSPTAGDGGDLGEFEMGTLAPRIQAAIEGLEPGDTTEVLDTDAGLQLFYLEAINRSEGKPIESVKAEIQQKLFAEVVDKKFVSWLETLRSQSHIKIIN